MKKYKGNRKLDDIRKLVIERGGTWDQTAYNRGSDYVTFEFIHKSLSPSVVYNTFNGNFIIKGDGGKYITERSKEMDGVDWYDDLLDTIFLPMEMKKLGAST